MELLEGSYLLLSLLGKGKKLILCFNAFYSNDSLSLLCNSVLFTYGSYILGERAKEAITQSSLDQLELKKN